MMLSQTGQADAVREFAVAVSDSLRKVGQRELPSMYLYDELGTALFEAITLLPEYGLTRAEERLLRRHAGDMLEHLPPPVAVVELGSGSGRKTRWILEALADREPFGGSLKIHVNGEVVRITPDAARNVFVEPTEEPVSGAIVR